MCPSLPLSTFVADIGTKFQKHLGNYTLYLQLNSKNHVCMSQGKIGWLSVLIRKALLLIHLKINTKVTYQKLKVADCSIN